MIIDSHLRCPWHGDRMLMEIGQNEDDGRCEVMHQATCCDYSEMDVQWRDKRVTVLADYRDRKTLAERLYEMRSGA